MLRNPVKSRIFVLMLRNLFVTFLSCFFLSYFSQTGPAGVGSTAINALWLKADKGTSSTVNNTPISQWNNQSGSGVNVSQTVAAQQPSFATNVINGFPAVQFDNVNSSGQNDKMIGPDSSSLDNTAGYTFFTVTRPQILDGNARVVVSKRTTVSVDQSFMLFYYTSNKFHVDIQTTDNRFNSVFTYAANNNYLIDVIYDGALPSGQRCRLYNGETLDITASESSAFVPDNNSPVILGATDFTDPRPYGGYIAEVIIYRVALNPAQRIIVNNYLSSKYDIALAANDKYAGDTPGNGDYDREVAGIGMESTGASTAFATGISGGMGITAVSGLDNGDYILAGHASATNGHETADVGGITGPNPDRWQRIWYIDVTNSATSISTNIVFGASDGGMGSALVGNVTSNYVLLYRAGQTGNWTELTTASSFAGDRVFFNSVNLTTDGYYTIGTRNSVASTLPIELIDFKAVYADNKVELKWSTGSEKNNALFTIEKTKDGEKFQTVAVVKGAGNSSVRMDYSSEDLQPYSGLSYYRLKQTDLSGESVYSKMAAVYLEQKVNDLSIYPNPSEGILHLSSQAFEGVKIKIQIVDALGKTCFSKSFTPEKNTLTIDTENKLVKGAYMVLVSWGEKTLVRKVIFR